MNQQEQAASPSAIEQQKRKDLETLVNAFAVIQAWNEPGPKPELHAAAKMKLRHEWPLLYKTVKRLAEGYGKKSSN